MSTLRRLQRRAPARRAALLLEVVIALAVLVAAMGLLGAQLAGSVKMATVSAEQFQATLLTDRVLELLQLDPELQRQLSEYEEFEDLFGKEYPGWFWRVHVEPVERDKEELKLVTIDVLYQRDLSQPENITGADLMRRVAFLKAPPGTIDLIEQAGLSEEMAEMLRNTIPIPGFDPHAVNLHEMIAMLDADTLDIILPMLMPLLQQIAAGGTVSGLSGLASELGAGGVPGAGGLPSGQADELEAQIREAVGAGGPPGGAGRPPGGIAGQPGRAPAPPGGAPGAVPPGPTGGNANAAGGGRRPPGAPTGPPPGRPPGRGGGAPPPPPPQGGAPGNVGGVNIGRGSGPNGEYTLEDLMRIRDEYERQQGGGP